MADSSGPTDDSPTGSPESSGGSSTWSWLLPAIAFLVGAALSAALFVLGDTDDDAPAATAAPTAQPTTSPSPVEEELVVQVPSVCVEAAELAETVSRALGDVADAAGALDARRLQETLDVVQQLRPEVEATSQACRDIALDGRIVTPETPETASPSPTATATG